MSKPTPSYTPELIAELRALVFDCETWLEARDLIVAKLGIHPDNATRMNRRHGFWKPSQSGGSVGSGSDAAGQGTPNTAASTGGVDSFSTDVQLSKAATLDEVIALCAVDTNVWESKGFNVRRGAKGFAWSARFAKREEVINVEELVAAFAERAAAHSPIFPGVKRVKQDPKGRLLEISVPDLHLAKLCWAQETGHQDYDIKIAADLFRKAVASIVESARGMGISRILFPIGNDLLNSDNAAGTTTAGTPQAQSEDSRWKKTYMTACDLIVEVVEELAAEFPVDVVVVAGNHDHERCFYLGQHVKAWFRQHPNVTVDNSAAQRRYYRFGQTLIGFTHGNEEKPERLPGIMANERRQLWAETAYHEWHLGHQHRQMVTEEIGTKIRWLPSLCPPDEWMASKGYIGNDQAAEGFVYDPVVGMIASVYFRA